MATSIAVPDPASMTPAGLRKILKKERGSIAQLARDLDIRMQTVSQWLDGRATSKRIEDAVRSRAAEILKGGSN